MKNHPIKIAVCALAALLSGATAHATYSNSVMSLQPVAYWPLTETTQPPSSQAANLGSTTSTNNAFYLPGVSQGITGALKGSTDTAASFNGSQGFLDLPYNSSLTISAPFSVEAWLNAGVGSAGATYCALAAGSFASPRSGWLLYNNNSGWNFRLYNQNGTTPSLNIQGGDTTVGDWHHVVGVYDGTNGSVYVDGVLVAGPTAAAFVPNVSGDLTIGARSDGGFLFNGSVDEVAIYSNALDPGTILSHYQNGTNTSPAQTYNSLILAANPTFYYRLDEPAVVSTATATNYGSWGSAINGNYQAGTHPGSLGPTNIGLPSPALACQFVPVGGTGAGGVVNVGADPRLNITNAMSVVAWFKGGPADNRFQSFLGKSDNAWRADMDPTFAHWADGGGNGDATGVTSVNDGNWHFFAGVYTGGNNYVYVDGALDGQATATPGFTGDATTHVVLGGVGDYATRNFLGSLAQVAIFTNALSAAQVGMLYDDSISLAPIIAQDPQNLALNNGATGSFNVISSGQPVQYFWYYGSTLVTNVPGNILGASTATLTISNASPANFGSYSVIVSNSFGTATSAVATLTVFSNIVITSDITPNSAILYSGGHATFSIQAGGTQPISYQWYSNTLAVAGATNTSFTLLNAANAAGVYCIAGNSSSSATSSTATVSIILPTTSYASTIVAANPVGFWRLNETNNPSLTLNAGATTYDYWGGHNGIYTNTTLGNPSYNPNDTNDTSAGFGQSASFTDNDAYNISVDFSAPTNSNSAFSIEAWAKGTTGPQSTDAGLVSKGYGGGGEQFNLDCGASTNHSFRFFVRDAGGATHGVDSSVSPADAAWHHLAAVCDEPNGTVYLYIDGLLIGTNSIAPGSGIQSSTRSMLIGSRPSTVASTGNDNQFVGNMADVSLYNYALSQSQVLSHYYSTGVPARVGVQPNNATAGQFGSATFTAVAVGTPVVSQQWYDAATLLPIAGATNSTLVLNNVQSSQNGSTYYLLVSNAFGTNQSVTVSLTVISGAPQITTDVQSPFFANTGGSGSDSVGGYGDEPLSFQWQFNGTNLSDVGGISGSHSNVITIANAQPSEAGNYRVIVSNGAGSATSSPALFIVGSSPIAFNVNGGGWQGNGNAIIATNQLTLSEGFGGEVSSFFYNAPQYVGAFRASFTYQDIGGGGADGSTFCIQNDPRGPAALGGGGGLLGVGGPPAAITPSAEVEINIYNGHIVGYTIQSGGITGGDGATYTSPGGVNVASGDPIDVVVNYAHGVIGLSLTDRTNIITTFSTNVVFDIPGAAGGTSAYVGFTGATGGVASEQTVTNFTFVSVPPTSIRASGGNAIISWPSEVLGFTLQQSTNVQVSNWTTVTNGDVIANGLHNVSVPIAGKEAFYRLFLP